ncbi:MAG TPA: L-histidine N(alpha)-methyltransferase [Bryobacteraceae bacterium]|nr:L-histidine N(alpha)-methyltransferase [Bryobacteraceae bacterium]
MKLEVVLTEAEIAQEFAEAIEARDLPEKFFYWSPRSAAAWRALSEDENLYGGLTGTWATLAAHAGLLATGFNGPIPVISFGAGDGARDRLLLDAFQECGSECRYFPVDASQALLEAACAAADDDDFETTGIKADISSPVHLIYAADAAEPPRLFIMSGNTLGVFDPLAEIRYVAQCMKAGDTFLVDGEIYEEREIMARRENPAVYGFVDALLRGVGLGRIDGEIRFESKIDERHRGLYQILRTFRAQRDLMASVNGEHVPLERGERIGLNFTYAYSPETFRWLLQDQGGFEILREYPSADGRFLTAVCRK